MGTRAHRKVFYQIDEACERWGITLLDAAAFVAEQRLRLSVAVAALPVTEGLLEEQSNGGPVRVPLAHRRRTGLVDLRPEDAWLVLRSGKHGVRWLAADPDSYLEIDDPSNPDWVLPVVRDEIGLRHEELIRFEAAEGLVSEPSVTPGRGRGAHPVHDWDGCWLEVTRLFYFSGVPETQAALIRHLQDWFGKLGKAVPDDSTLKKKYRDLWRDFAPEAKRPTAGQGTPTRAGGNLPAAIRR